jgi:ABC-type dipeptide/oligopeptide/nickel transport system permease component
MTAYLIRSILQMILVLFISAVATYALLNFAPGGPSAGLAPGSTRLGALDHRRRHCPYSRLF